MNGSTTATVAALGLIPHPEGGFFCETFRSGAAPMQSKGLTDPSGTLAPTDREGGTRNELTSILYKVVQDQPFHWMICNLSDHVHYWHGGGALTYLLVSPEGGVETVTLGPDVAKGQRLQVAVPGGWFKGAELVQGSEYCLLGEAVAPGFDFRDLTWVSDEMLTERIAGKDVDPAMQARLRALVKDKSLCVEDTAAFYD